MKHGECIRTVMGSIWGFGQNTSVDPKKVNITIVFCNTELESEDEGKESWRKRKVDPGTSL